MFWRTWLFSIAVLFAPYVALPPAHAEKRVALVIGNANYSHVDRLSNPIEDAKGIAGLLNIAGFTTVQTRYDLNATTFRRALADFQSLAQDADVAVIYYSGHGIEFQGQNYLVPVDATIERRVDVKDETISLDRVLEAVAGATRLKLVILDSCRTDPFKALSDTKSLNRGLARVEPTEANELIAYSARAGTAALDGPPGGHSPYTSALLNRLATPGLDIELALRRVRDDVLTATGREQAPFYYGSMGGDEITIVPSSNDHVALTQPSAPPASVQSLPPSQQMASLGLSPLSTSIGDCDRLAGVEGYRVKSPIGKGIDFDQIDPSIAIPACRTATLSSPNEPRLMFALARSLQKKDGTDTEALKLFSLASNLGYGPAFTSVGRMYANGDTAHRNYAVALNLLQSGAEAGDPSAQYSLGQMYDQGLGTEVNYSAAMSLFKKAAEGGAAEGLVGQGDLYANGHGVTQDYTQAATLYGQAIEVGSQWGASNSGFVWGTASLGILYETGSGVPQNSSEAARLFHIAAENGDIRSMTLLGAAYENGKGIQSQPTEAFRWYLAAAKAGNVASMVKVARMYTDSYGIEKSNDEAFKWISRAAEAQEPTAMLLAGIFYQYGQVVPRDYQKAKLFYEKAAAKGKADAMQKLGDLYARGLGVQKSQTQARLWYRRATEAGNKVALAEAATPQQCAIVKGTKFCN